MIITNSRLFCDWCPVVEFSTSLRFKEKQKIRQAITDHGGTISYIINKKCSCLIVTDKDNTDTYKCRSALKLGIPVVSIDFLWDSVENGKLGDYDKYVVAGTTKADNFSKGKITASIKQDQKVSSFLRVPTIDPANVKVWSWGDNKAPFFDEENYEIAKCHILTKKKDSKTSYLVLEIHVSGSLNAENRYRVFCQSGLLGAKVSDELDEVRYVKTSEDVLCLYSYLHKKQTSFGYREAQCLPSFEIGSSKFKTCQADWIRIDSDDLSPQVTCLVQHLWAEAVGEIEQTLATPVDQIKIDQIEKAEGILLQIRTALIEKKETSELTGEFYNTIPHVKTYKTAIDSKHMLAKKQDFCQLLRDIISVSESTDWSVRSSALSKYRALRCNITDLRHSNSEEFETVEELIGTQSSQDRGIHIENIYSVCRSVEELKSDKNRQLLFHASAVKNFVGILSRGLLLPKVVVDDYGGSRTDAGMLGCGIYFTDSVKTSVKYSKPSSVRGSRMMLVCDVALGNCKDYYKFDTGLTAPPAGYDSTHGVRNDTERNIISDFKDGEYVVYDVGCQRLKYLVEFSLAEDNVRALDSNEEVTEDSLSVDEDDSGVVMEVDDITGLSDPLSKVKAGLVSNNDTPVPLTSVHVQAHLEDLAAQVVVLQRYENDSDVPIEAKFVFPLDEMAAVCGFEAFINGKHIVGEVKEKETAHREYKKAISEGHGAYLMDQDEETPDVFTVSVGNLPPLASVLIKITYVAELQVDGENIIFNVPGSVAPWKKDANLAEITQADVETRKVTEGSADNLSISVNIEMPFDIRTIRSPSHKIRVKKTATKAVVQMAENQSLGDGFQVCVGLAEIHVPRMWVEQDNEDSRNQACMLTFYPEFEARESETYEAIFVLDVSNSMKGTSLNEAKKAMIVALHKLPSTCHFNVLVFGTTFEEYLITPQRKTREHVKNAITFIQHAKASKGNTELILPLTSLLLLRPTRGIRNVFLFSDGHLNNSEKILQTAYANSKHTRIFTCGFGTTANRYMLRTLARVSGGSYEYFDSKTKSKWEQKISSQLEKAAQPGLTSVTVDWETHGAEGEQIQAPSQITSMFNGSRLVVYGFIPNCTQATLRAEIDQQEVSTMVSTHELQISHGQILHRLTAKAIIDDWEDGTLSSDRTEHEALKMKRKSSIIELSKKYSIVTQFTSFIAVEKRDEGEIFDGDTLFLERLIDLERVDILDYIGWDDDGRSVTDQMPSEQRIKQLMNEACQAESTSVLRAEELYKSAWSLVLDQSDTLIVGEIAKKIATFYTEVMKDQEEAELYRSMSGDYEIVTMGGGQSSRSSSISGSLMEEDLCCDALSFSIMSPSLMKESIYSSAAPPLDAQSSSSSISRSLIEEDVYDDILYNFAMEDDEQEYGDCMEEDELEDGCYMEDKEDYHARGLARRNRSCDLKSESNSGSVEMADVDIGYMNLGTKPLPKSKRRGAVAQPSQQASSLMGGVEALGFSSVRRGPVYGAPYSQVAQEAQPVSFGGRPPSPPALPSGAQSFSFGGRSPSPPVPPSGVQSFSFGGRPPSPPALPSGAQSFSFGGRPPSPPALPSGAQSLSFGGRPSSPPALPQSAQSFSFGGRPPSPPALLSGAQSFSLGGRPPSPSPLVPPSGVPLISFGSISAAPPPPQLLQYPALQAACRRPLLPRARMAAPPPPPKGLEMAAPPPPPKGLEMAAPPPPPKGLEMAAPPPPPKGLEMAAPPPPPKGLEMAAPPPPPKGLEMAAPPPPPKGLEMAAPPPPPKGLEMAAPPPLPKGLEMAAPPPPPKGLEMVAPPPRPKGLEMAAPPPPPEYLEMAAPPPPPKGLEMVAPPPRPKGLEMAAPPPPPEYLEMAAPPPLPKRPADIEKRACGRRLRAQAPPSPHSCSEHVSLGSRMKKKKYVSMLKMTVHAAKVEDSLDMLSENDELPAECVVQKASKRYKKTRHGVAAHSEETDRTSYKTLSPLHDGKIIYDNELYDALYQTSSLDETIVFEYLPALGKCASDLMLELLTADSSVFEQDNIFNTILISAGIRSLGKTREQDIRRYLAILVQAIQILQETTGRYTVMEFPRDHGVNLINEVCSDLPSIVSVPLQQFSSRMLKQYGCVYSDLELGKSWVQAAARLLLSISKKGFWP